VQRVLTGIYYFSISKAKRFNISSSDHIHPSEYLNVFSSVRMTVSEYVEHESLHHWLHEFPAQTSPLTWDIRKNIIHSVAEG